MKNCSCGISVADNAAVCPTCGHRFTRGSVKLLACVLGIGLVIGFLNGLSAPHANPAVVGNTNDRAPPPGVTNDAELLLARCGRPTKDESTENNTPRPLIPSRVIEYKRQDLRFLFLPDSKLTDAPPYRWKLIGIIDATATNPSEAQVVDPTEAAKRLPCWLGNTRWHSIVAP